MKSKRTTYLLLAVVAGIWGLIGWKVWKGLQGDDAVLAVPDKAVRPKTSLPLSDSFVLIANYRDPFLGRAAAPVRNISTTPNTTNRTQTPVVAPPPPVAMPWPEIRYGGFVKKAGQDAAAGFLVISGGSEIVRQGQQVAGLTVGRVWRDSVEVFRGKEKRIIKK